VKITATDITNDVPKTLSSVSANNILEITGGRNFTTGAFTKYQADLDIVKYKHNVANIYGASKPNLFIKNRQVFVDFVDNGIQLDQLHLDGVAAEPFYSTPDMPEITVEQAHRVLDWIKTDWRLQDLFYRAEYNNELYESVLRTVIYPDHDNTRFQLVKSKGFMNPYYNFIHKAQELSEALTNQRGHLIDFLKSIDKDMIVVKNGMPFGIKALHSGSYFIGTVPTRKL
jgi:hypothetical protein